MAELLAQLQGDFDQMVEQLGQMRQESPHIFAAIEKRYRETLGFSGEDEIETEALVYFAQEYQFSLTTGERAKTFKA